MKKNPQKKIWILLILFTQRGSKWQQKLLQIVSGMLDLFKEVLKWRSRETESTQDDELVEFNNFDGDRLHKCREILTDEEIIVSDQHQEDLAENCR